MTDNASAFAGSVPAGGGQVLSVPPEYTPGKQAPFAGISNPSPLRELASILVDQRVLF